MGIELLVVDHLYSLTREHVLVLLSDAGLAVDHAGLAPPGLGAFQMVIARARPVSPLRMVNSPIRLIEDKEEYLRRWLDLDAHLLRRFGDREAVCFGIGETAGLLRAYAPTAWQRVQACTADNIVENGQFGTLPVVSLEALPREQPLLVAVRPQEQAMVAERLSSRFHHVITWYDLVLGEKL